MLKKRLFGAMLATCALSVSAQSALTVEKLNSLDKVHSVALSSNGEYLVYGVKTPSRSDLFLQRTTTGKVSQLTSHPSYESSVIWTKDSQSVYFLANRNGSSQIWKININGGEAVQVTDFPLDVTGFKLSPDGKKFAVAFEVLAHCETLACSVKEIEKLKRVPHSAQVYNQLPVRHWDTWEDGLRSHIFIADITDKQITTAKDITPKWDTDIPAKPFAGMEEVTFTPDSLNIVFSAKAPSSDQAWTTNYDLFQVSIEGGEIKNLTPSNKAWDAHPTFSPDGRYLAYVAMKRPGFEADRFGLMLKDLRSGDVKEVAPLWDRSVSSFTFSENSRALYVTAQDVGQKSIFEISTNFGDVRTVYSDGIAGDIQLSGNEIYFTRHALNSPKQIYKINKDGSELTQLTQLNKEQLKDVQFGDFEQFKFNGWNNETVHGYLVKPWNFKADQSYPIAFLVHGGPQGSFGNMFHYRWNAQLWAAQGYGVVMVDFHGSTGYGQAFTDSISRDWGGKPLEDLQKGLQYVTNTYKWLDGSNACALGASYGGYMMNWIAGNWPTGFKCLVNHAGLYDMPSFYQSTEELWFPEYEMGGPVWNKSEDYQKFNPANFAENWKTPMLVIHGLKDYRVPYAQGLGAYTNLQRKGIDSKLVIYPDENHWILKKENLVHWYSEVFDWMKRYTQD